MLRNHVFLNENSYSTEAQRRLKWVSTGSNHSDGFWVQCYGIIHFWNKTITRQMLNGGSNEFQQAQIIQMDSVSNATESFIFERKHLLDRGSTEAQMSLNRLKSFRWILNPMLRNHLFLKQNSYSTEAQRRLKWVSTSSNHSEGFFVQMLRKHLVLNENSYSTEAKRKLKWIPTGSNHSDGFWVKCYGIIYFCTETITRQRLNGGSNESQKDQIIQIACRTV